MLVLIPLLLLGWGGIRLAAHEREEVKANIEQLLTNQLAEIDREIQSQFSLLADEMQVITTIDHYDAAELREIVRNDPRIFQLFVIDPEDLLLYPAPAGALTNIERSFLLKAADLINDRKLQLSAPLEAQEDRLLGEKSPRTGGWHVWYWGSGMHLIYWQRRANGHIVGVALERSRWVADIITELPDTPINLKSNSTTVSRTQIIESGSNTIYKWGAFDPPPTESPSAEHRLSAPLSAWQLQTFVPLGILSAGQSGTQNLIAGLVLSGLALIGLAFAIERQYGRDMREATRRVSFVNQVSHELRTPLTNIRMYAELLAQDLESLEEEGEQPQRRLNVILNECQRLTRLIGNVLTFARQEKQTLQVCPKPVQVDEVIKQVIDSFRPSLNQKGIEVVLELNACETVQVDADMLEQILVNLISNVEKYAANGKWMKISSHNTEGITTFSVADHGPGIEQAQRSKVFTPFWRASDNLNQSAGTGIGLTIVRHLSRLHGGDAILLPSQEGAEFQVTLRHTGGMEDEDSDR
jgi:signal transduction histidine kinase